MKSICLLLCISLFGFTLPVNPAFIHKALPLEYVVRQPKSKSDKAPLIILLHGIGSNEKDLFTFSDHLPDKYLVVSARAPIKWGENVYAWYPIDFAKKPSYKYADVAIAENRIIDFINQLHEKYDFDPNQVYLCGFSQGAIMSYAVALARPDLVKGIAVMSGKILDEVKLHTAPQEKLQQLKVFICHGTNDNKIALSDAQASAAFLKELGVNPVYNEYAGAGHEINPDMLKDLIAWFNN